MGQDVAEEIELMVTELSVTLVLAPWADVFQRFFGMVSDLFSDLLLFQFGFFQFFSF